MPGFVFFLNARVVAGDALKDATRVLLGLVCGELLICVENQQFTTHGVDKYFRTCPSLKLRNEDRIRLGLSLLKTLVRASGSASLFGPVSGNEIPCYQIRIPCSEL